MKTRERITLAAIVISPIVLLAGLFAFVGEVASRPQIPCRDGYVLLTRATGGPHVCVPGYVP